MSIEDVESAVLENFAEAFGDSIISAQRVCACGRIFYDPNVSSWDWDEGEIDKLHENPNATALDYGVEGLLLEGTTYVKDCECWKPRAQQIARWLRENDLAIVEFFNLEKKRKQAACERSPTVAG